MNRKKANANKIKDKLLNTEINPKNYYYIDFVPITFPNEDYSELSEYLNKDFKPHFAKKIIFIAFTILYYYDSHVFLDDTDEKPLYPKLINKDLRRIGLDKLAKLIKKIIIENWSALYIIFDDGNQISIMVIEDGYDTYFKNLSKSSFKMIDQLVSHQGLFLKKYINN